MEIRDLLPFLDRQAPGEGRTAASDRARDSKARPGPQAADRPEPGDGSAPAEENDGAGLSAVAPPAAASAAPSATDADAVAEELRARRAEIARMEEQALRNAESINVQLSELERRRQTLDDRERNLEQQLEELKRVKQVQRRELEQVSGLSVAQAKQILVREVEDEARHQAGLTLSLIHI